MEACSRRKKAGKVRFIGFTGHKDPLVHLRMLEVADEHEFHFDAVQMPLNVMDAHFRSFEQQVLPVLDREQIGVLGMKAYGRTGSFSTATPPRRSSACTTPESAHLAVQSPASTACRSSSRRSKPSAPSSRSRRPRSPACCSARGPPPSRQVRALQNQHALRRHAAAPRLVRLTRWSLQYNAQRMRDVCPRTSRSS